MKVTGYSLLLADARTPSGSHAHSGGLEGAVSHGLERGEVLAFIRGRLRTAAYTEAAISARATEARRDAANLRTLDAEAVARCTTPPLREASRSLGRALLRTARSLFPGDEPLDAYRGASELTPRPVAFGVMAGAAGLGPAEAAFVSLYEDAAAVASAAVKLLPVDAAEAAGWIGSLLPAIDRLAAEAVATEDLPSLTAPLIDLRSLDHDERRLFAS